MCLALALLSEHFRCQNVSTGSAFVSLGVAFEIECVTHVSKIDMFETVRVTNVSMIDTFESGCVTHVSMIDTLAGLA